MANSNSALNTEIPYLDVNEFMHLWNTTAKFVAEEIARRLQSQLSQANLTGNTRLVWLDMDMILFGIPNLDNINEFLEVEIYKALKGTNLAWCKKSTKKLLEFICSTSKTYIDTIRNHAVVIDQNFYANLIYNDIIARMGNVCITQDQVPFIFNYESLAYKIFHKNFNFNYVDDEVSSCWSAFQRQQLCLLLLANSRFCQNNNMKEIKCLNDDIISHILKVVIRWNKHSQFPSNSQFHRSD